MPADRTGAPRLRDGWMVRPSWRVLQPAAGARKRAEPAFFIEDFMVTRGIEPGHTNVQLSRVARREINRRAQAIVTATHKPGAWPMVRDALLRRVQAGEALLTVLDLEPDEIGGEVAAHLGCLR